MQLSAFLKHDNMAHIYPVNNTSCSTDPYSRKYYLVMGIMVTINWYFNSQPSFIFVGLNDTEQCLHLQALGVDRTAEITH